MSDPEHFEGMLYQYELLQTRLKIKEHYLQSAVRDVHENIGQVLSLIRLQLSLLQVEMSKEYVEKLEPLRQMTGQVIRDLRNMCRTFYPEADIINGEGFCRILKNEIKVHWPEADLACDSDFLTARVMSNEKMLMVFGIMLELLTFIKEKQQGQLQTVAITCADQKISIIVVYTGNVIPNKKVRRRQKSINTTVFERARLIGGYLEVNNNKDTFKEIMLIIPLTQNL